MYNSLRNGDFGKCDSEVEQFREHCHQLFPYANYFSKNTEVLSNDQPDSWNCQNDNVAGYDMSESADIEH